MPSQNCTNGASTACTGANTVPVDPNHPSKGGKCTGRNDPGFIGTIYICDSSQTCADGGQPCDPSLGPKCCGQNTTGKCLPDPSNATNNLCETPHQAGQSGDGTPAPAAPPPC